MYNILDGLSIKPYGKYRFYVLQIMIIIMIAFINQHFPIYKNALILIHLKHDALKLLPKHKRIVLIH